MASLVAMSVLPAAAPAQILPQQAQTPTRPSVPTGSPVLQQPGMVGSGNVQVDPQYPDPVSNANRIGPTEIRDDEPLTLQNQYRTVLAEPNPRLKPPPKPNAFETFVSRVTGTELPRFGADLLLPSNRDYAVPAVATVPPSYLLSPGDRIQIAMTGSVDGSVERTIDTDGRIFLPSVGSVQVAGVRYGDLRDRIAAAIGLKYRNFTVNVAIRQLRGVRVYVTGFANNPGAYTVNSLSTLVNAVLAAGGPSSGGSFRSIKLYRNNELVSDFDLYRMLLRGDRTGDAVLQNEDVLFVSPIGEQVAVTGSVNNPAIFELRQGESVETLLGYAGGADTLADPSRILLYRQSNYDTIGAQELQRRTAPATVAMGGDIFQLLSNGNLQRSLERQSVIVRIEGEVNRPGNYYLPAGTPLGTVLEQAGGLTGSAFVYGTRFERSSVRSQQRDAFREAINQFELSLAAAPLTADQSISQGERDAQLNGARASLERLRQLEPDGRVVLDIRPDATDLDRGLVVENNDRIVIPARPTTVGVFGAVYRPASFALGSGSSPGGTRVRDFVQRAGGVLRAGNSRDIFVVRASGDVISRKRGALNATVLPGDVIFVPIRTQSSSVWAKIRDITTIALQAGLSAATIVALTR